MRRSRLIIIGLVFVLFAVAAAGGWLSLRGVKAPARELPLADAERILLDAARAGETELVTGLVKAGVPVETRDAKGYSALILAAYHGHLATVEALLALGADGCAGDARGSTALMGAAFKGYVPVIERLSKEPCAVDQANALGQTALMFATLFGRNDAARALEAKGADPTRRDAAGLSASDWASTQRP